MKIIQISLLLGASSFATLRAESPYLQGRLSVNLGVQRCNGALQADLRRIQDEATDGGLEYLQLHRDEKALNESLKAFSEFKD
jgi:hypothetical protein